jgi:hypothetical protein
MPPVGVSKVQRTEFTLRGFDFLGRRVVRVSGNLDLIKQQGCDMMKLGSTKRPLWGCYTKECCNIQITARWLSSGR